ncbi:unnamed protein product [Sympodiomycopsis kandeliae]
MFERTLESLIKGLRSNRGADEAAFVGTLLEEIRHELRSGQMEVKAGAVLKLTYLQMLGYPSSHASFPTLEVMASPLYHLKQVGYLAASHTFNHDTDVLILVTNLIKKDLHSANPLEVAVALNGLSHIVTPDLAQHVVSDIVGMMNHSRASIRKKAILAFYAIAQQYPDAIDQGWHRLQEKLQDEEPGVVSATVNIVCEMARKNPVPFLPLSPQLFELLNSSSNNWMLIKIVKLFGYLTPHEPRLVRKLLPPIKALISNTPAMSLLYESIHSVISGEMLDGPGGDELARECVDRLAAFLDDEDSNLRYIALLALVRILPTHPHLVAEFQESIFHSIDDQDLSIRLRALDLVTGMASRANSETIVEQLMSHLQPVKSKPAQSSSSAAAALMKRTLQNGGAAGVTPPADTTSSPTSSPSYRLEISRRILTIGSRDTFANIDDFEWYISTLVSLAKISGVAIGKQIRDQIMDIASRVRAIRPFVVKEMVKLLEDESFLINAEHDMADVLEAAAWVCGEFASEVNNPRLIVPLLLRKELQEYCSNSTLASCIHNAVKLFAHWAASLSEVWSDDLLAQVANVASQAQTGLAFFTEHPACEVSKRATEFLQLFKLLQRDLDSQIAALEAKKAETGQTSESKSEATAETGRKEGTSPTTSLAPPPTDESTAMWSEGVSDASAPPSSISTRQGPKSLHLLSPLFFPHPFGPVAERAQSKVPPPRDIDLRVAIVSPNQWEIPSISKTKPTKSGVAEGSSVARKKTKKDIPGDEDKRRTRKKELAEKRAADPYYISHSSNKGKGKADDDDDAEESGRSKRKSKKKADYDDLDDVPIVQLTLEDLPDLARKEGKKSITKAKKAQKEALLIQETEEMPDGHDEEIEAVEPAVSKVKKQHSDTSGTQSDVKDSGSGSEVQPIKAKKKKRPKAAATVLD